MKSGQLGFPTGNGQGRRWHLQGGFGVPSDGWGGAHADGRITRTPAWDDDAAPGGDGKEEAAVAAAASTAVARPEAKKLAPPTEVPDSWDTLSGDEEEEGAQEPTESKSRVKAQPAALQVALPDHCLPD